MQTQTTTQPVLLSKQKTANMLEVCEATVVNYHKKGDLPGIRVGKFLRFKIEDVESFRNTGSVSKNSY